MTFKFLMLSALMTFMVVQFAQAQVYERIADTAETQFWKGWAYTFIYPKNAAELNISGKIVVSFDIDSMCSVLNVKLVKGIGYGYDEAAIKAVKTVKPGYPKNHKCSQRQNVLQSFTIESNED